ncbi:MAG TPA: DUF445 family protein [Clostridia bacterium]|nr:DUF445 family protein [Clostridia bacterium]
MNPQWIVGPLMGGIIGYITNDLAIRMLFRPLKPVLVFGRKLPFTPGLIPKERFRIAKGISDMVSRSLLSREVLSESLLSGPMLEKIEQGLDAALAHIMAEERTPRTLLTGGTDGEKLNAQVDSVSKTLAGLACEKLLQSGFEQLVAGRVIQELRDRLLQSPISPLRLFWDDRLTQTLTDKLSLALREMVENQGPEMMENMIRGVLDDGLDTPVNVLLERVNPVLPELRSALLRQYEKLVREQLGRLLEAVDIGAIVEQRINALDILELENLLLDLMRRELRVIVWLGALLGAIMGLGNALWAVFF